MPELPEVEALRAPSLKGGHPREKAFNSRREGLEGRRETLLETATEFAGMVPLRPEYFGVFIDRTEVTNAAYLEFVQDGGYTRQDLWLERDWAKVERFVDKTRKHPGPKTWQDGPPAGKADHPVSGISIAEARAFAAWKGKSLPSLDQWCDAAAPPDLKYPWGDTSDAKLANLHGTGLDETAPVGSFPEGAGPTGALDMIGNVREIVTHAERAYAVGASYEKEAEAVSRTREVILSLEPSARLKDVGFRCVKVLKWDE